WTSRHHGLHRLECTQAEFNLLARRAETELFPAMRAIGMSLLPYFPLASGLLTGKYRKGAAVPEGRMSLPWFRRELNDANLERVEKLVAFAEQRGRTILELAMSWLLAEPLVASVIAGATKAEQVQANVRAA